MTAAATVELKVSKAFPVVTANTASTFANTTAGTMKTAQR